MSAGRWPKEIRVSRLYRILNQLGITANHAGFHYICQAVCLIAEDPDYLLLVTKRLYPEIARRHHTSWHRVERDIRTVISLGWATDRALMESLASRPLSSKPQPAQFLAFLATFLLSADADRS